MKTELRPFAHDLLPAGHVCVELWHDGKFVGVVYGADTAGVRIISRHPIKIGAVSPGMPNVLEVEIRP